MSGQRSDTILLLHIPGNGGPAVLVSLPRDSYVNIPGHGWNKLNAAYSFGGPSLLAETVQNATGLRIEGGAGSAPSAHESAPASLPSTTRDRRAMKPVGRCRMPPDGRSGFRAGAG